MNEISFYIVFHKRLFYSNTASFTREQIERYFVWMGVNEKIPKQIPDTMKDYPILYEYNLPWYRCMYQEQNYYQNSVFIHLWRNPEILPKKYIGFGQYDMRISAEKFLPIVKGLETDNGKTLIGVYNFPQETCFDILNADLWETIFLTCYNRFYNQNHDLKSLKSIPFFLYHTFIIPTNFFLKMMPFVDLFIPRLMKLLLFNTRHLAGTLERVFAFCIACSIKENQFDNVLILNDVDHIEGQHEEDTLRNIKQGDFIES